MNEAAFDDDDDGCDSMHSYQQEPASGPLGSPDLIAGMRRAAKQKCLSYEEVAQPSAEFDHKEFVHERLVCSYGAFSKMW